jgi:hypothetical protein
MLTLSSQYVLYLIIFIAQYQYKKKCNYIDKQQILYHIRRVYYASLRMFNQLPASSAELLKGKTHFIFTLRSFIFETLYSINGYLNN